MTPNYDFDIQIGDWSGTGHGKCDVFHFCSNKPIQDVREAYFKAQALHPTICPNSFCSEYEDAELPQSVVKESSALGYDWGEFYEDDFDMEQMAKYTAWFCTLGDSTLEIVANNNPVPTLGFWGFDEKDRHIDFIGYGLYE